MGRKGLEIGMETKGEGREGVGRNGHGKGREGWTWIFVQRPRVPSYATAADV